MGQGQPLDEKSYLGMAGEAARTKAEESGWVVRVYRAGDALTLDFRSNRLNLRVDETGRVVEAAVF